MPYLSHILGKRVMDSVGQPVGRIVDMAITIEEPFGGEFPPVTLVLVRAGSTNLRLRWEMISDIHSLERNSVALLDTPRARVTVGQEKAGEIYLRKDVFDKQILDVSNARLVRVNDVFLIEDGDRLRVAGVDVSFRGLMRRVRMEEFAVSLLRRFRVNVPRQHIPWNQVEIIRGESGAGGKIISKVPADKLSKLHPTDLANIVAQMTPSERAELIEQLDDETVALALEEADDEVAADIIEEIAEKDEERAADIIEEMDPDEAADVLGELDSEAMAERILDKMDDPEEAADIKHLLSYDEGTAGALMNTDIIGIPEGFTCAEALARLRSEQPSPHTLHYLHLEDEDEKLTGVVSLAEVVLAEPSTPLRELAEDEVISVEPETDAGECARLIAKYDLLSLPVVDFNRCLLGVVTVDDMLDEIVPEELATRRVVQAETMEEE